MEAVPAAAEAPAIPKWILIATGLAAVFLGALVAWDPGVTAVAFVTLCVCLLSWWRPAAVIAGLAFYIPIERFITVRLPDLAFMMSQATGEIVLLALLAGVLTRRAARRQAFVSTPADLALLAFVGVCAVSAFANGVSPQSAAYGVRIVLRYAIVFYAIVNGDFKRSQMKLFVKLLLAAVSIQIAIGLLQTLTGGAAKEWFTATREVSIGGVDFIKGQDKGTGEGLATVIFGTLEDYNSYGHFMSLAWVAVFAISRSKGHFGWRKGLWAILMFTFLCVILSFSRSSLLIIVVGAAVVLYRSGSRKLSLAIVFALIGGLGLITFVGMRYSGSEIPVYSTSLFYRWVRPFTPERLALTDAGNYRLFLLLIVSVRVISQAPFLGLGPGTFGSGLTLTGRPEIYEGLRMNYEYAGKFAGDSNWTTIVAQTGIIGLLALCAFLFGMAAFCAGALRKSRDPVVKGLCLSQLGMTTAIVLAAFFSSAFENRFTSYYYWAISGLAVAAARAEGIASGRGRLRRLLGAKR